ncbi:MAG: GNAT family N-acetyltransferase [Candidatus Thermoplasmatota archaeon]|nr:GNAT family N-acetyltransferase [Candidatus Thermoplasmatota archaeon]
MELKGNIVILSDDLDGKNAVEISKIASDPEISRSIGSHGFPFPYTEEDALFFLEKNRSAGGFYFQRDFIIRSEGRIVGIIGLSDIDSEDMNAHVGYWIGKAYWNHGYASDALSVICNYADHVLHLRKLYTRVLEFNLRSLRVLMKNGFVVEGFIRDCFRMDNRFYSMFDVSRLF